MVLLLLLSCQDPFPEDRHDLLSFRIAAMGASWDGSLLHPYVLISGDQGFFHDTPPQLSWQLGDQTATGARPTFQTDFPAELSLTAVSGSFSEQAVLTMAAPPAPPSLSAWSRKAVDLALEDALLSPDERQREGEDGPISPGGAAEISLSFNGGGTIRWMGTGGELVEMDAQRSNWFAGNFLIDDGELLDSRSIDPGIYPLVGLSLDGQGGNSWALVDVAVGEVQAIASDGRLIATDAPFSGEGLIVGTFNADDSVSGFHLSNLSPASSPTDVPAVCQQEEGTLFDPAWLVEGLCGRTELEGQQVILQARRWP